MKQLLTTAFLFIFFVAAGQTDSVHTFQKDSLYYKTYMPTLKPKLMLNKKIISSRHEKEIFNEVPSSIPYYKKYKSRFTIGLISAGITALTVVAIEFPKKQGTKNIITFSAIGLFINSEFFLISGVKNLRKAIKIRNQAVLHY